MVKSYKIGSWLVEPEQNLLKSDSQEVKIEPQAMALLCYLIKHQGQPVNRHKLIEDVWHNKVVSDHAVYKTINQLRKSLAMDGQDIDYIKTVPKKGYLLQVAVVEVIEQASEPVQEIEVKTAEVKQLESAEFELNQASAFKKSLFLIKKYRLLSAFSLLLIIVSIGWFSGANRHWYQLNQPVYSNISSLSHLPGIKRLPSISPDGKYLLVAVQEKYLTSNRDLYLVHLASQEQYKLTDGQYDYSDFTWSVTGNKIAASRRNSSLYYAKECKIVILDLNEQFTAVSSESEITDCSAKSSRLAFDDIKNLIYYEYAESSITPASIYSINPDTRKIERLTVSTTSAWGDLSLSLSPDRKKLAFARVSTYDETLMLYDLELKQERELFKLPDPRRELSWTPDSQNIIYQSARTGISIYSLKYGFTKNLISSALPLETPRHSLHEQSIAVVNYVDSTDIYIQNNPRVLQPTEPELTVSSNGRDLYPTFSNTSYAFSYVSNRSGSWQIWIKDEQGKEKQLSHFVNGEFIQQTVWSSDDKYILTSYNGKLFLVSVETGEHSLLFEDKELMPDNLSWSQDEKSIYFTGSPNEEYQIYQLDIDTKTVKQITNNGGYEAMITADKESMYYLKYYQEGLWKLSLASGLEEKVFDKANVDSYWSFKAVADGFYFNYVFEGYENIYFYSFRDKNVQLINNDVSYGFPTSISFDEKYILTNKYRVTDSILNIHRP